MAGADYADISPYVNKADRALDAAAQRLRLEHYHARREHLSVWTSASFRQSWIAALEWNGIDAEPAY